MRTLILAGSFREASIYARARGLRFYRFASSAAAVENFSAQRVVELPGFARRADRHALIAVANRVTRRGGEWVKDEYIPEPVEETPLTKLAAFTRADWLFAGCDTTPKQAAQYDAIAAIADLGEDDLRAVGATDDEIKLLKPELTEEQKAAVLAANEPKKPEPKLAAKPKRTRKTAPRKPRSANAPVPAAAESTDSLNDLDDLFED